MTFLTPEVDFFCQPDMEENVKPSLENAGYEEWKEELDPVLEILNQNKPVTVITGYNACFENIHSKFIFQHHVNRKTRQ